MAERRPLMAGGPYRPRPLIEGEPPRYRAPFPVPYPNPAYYGYGYPAYPNSPYPHGNPRHPYHMPYFPNNMYPRPHGGYYYPPQPYQRGHFTPRHHNNYVRPNSGGCKPLLPKPPPLMPYLPSYVQRFEGRPVKYSNGEMPSNQNENSSVSSSDGKESPSPLKHFSSKYIKELAFFKTLDPLGLSNEGEMLIRGTIECYDDTGMKGYLKSGSHLAIEVDQEVMYIMGRKISLDEKFQDVLAPGSSVKAFIKGINGDSEDDTNDNPDENTSKSVTYKALIAWFGEVPEDSKALPTVVQVMKNEEMDNSSDDIDGGADDSSKKRRSTLTHVVGYVWWADKDQGILRIYSSGGWGSFEGILFKTSAIRIRGQEARCASLQFLVAHFNKCVAWARRIEPMVIHGMKVVWEADYVECNQVPAMLLKHVLTAEILADNCKSDDDSNLDLTHEDNDGNTGESQALSNSSKFEENIGITTNNNSQQIFEEDSFDSLNIRDTEIMLKNLKIKKEDPFLNSLEMKEMLTLIEDEEYCGKHMTGRIIDLFSVECDFGIAQWNSMEFGDVNIIFKQSSLFVDLVPASKTMKLSPALHTRRCNLYVLPLTENLDFKGYEVKLVATCGWLGSKPHLIPTPGEQPKAKIELKILKDSLNVDKNHSSEVSLNKSNEDNTKDNMKLFNLDSSGEGDSTNGFENDGVNWQEVSGRKKIDERTSPLGIGTDQKVYFGELIEVYFKMGKLLAKDGTTHFFSRDQCYLSSLSLEQVELWHVLVHGQKVSFTLNRNAGPQGKIEKVIVGQGSDSTVSSLSTWCDNNSVTDIAKKILVEQLRKKQRI